MKPKQIIQQIIWFPWTLWCGLVIGVLMFMAFPVLVIAVISRNEKWIRAVHYLPPFVARIVLFLWGIRIKEIGKDLAVTDGQSVFISNHTSYLDGIIAGAVIHNFLKFLGKGEILTWPVLGYLLKHLYVAVWRDDKQHRAWSMAEMKEKLKTGASFFICPEGTCNTTTDFFTHFHSGAYRLAIDNKLPLVPLTFIGAGQLFPRNGLMIKPGKITVYWHPAIDTSQLTADDVDALKVQTIEIMRKNLLLHFPGGKYL